MLPFFPVNFIYIPWDFVLILLFLGTFVPWRGAARMKQLMAKHELSSSDRLSLYGSTIFYQWLLAAVVAWRVVARDVSPEELGITAADPWRVLWTAVLLTALLCANQFFGLRKISTLPADKRGSIFAVTEKIMPRTSKEKIFFSGLALTAGLSEEFLYRGFVYMAFYRMVVNYGPSDSIAGVLSSVWFSLAHLYQGKRGLITTFVVGSILVSVRIWTGSLIPVMIAHAAIDLVAGLYASKILPRT
ncbi:MAG TPA: CPBP family intramembrane glutamic endopeptidase [Candidatus Acidoferrales bacterium]|jgi:membrane protease YdiL (CAAX protease family)|nr:CPBP family intramembrane glutamic endopeptidase [Candidatus Acidoferrales bacterium]